MAKTVENVILHGTFTAKKLAGLRMDTAKSDGRFIIIRSEQMTRSILGHWL